MFGPETQKVTHQGFVGLISDLSGLFFKLSASVIDDSAHVASTTPTAVASSLALNSESASEAAPVAVAEAREALKWEGRCGYVFVPDVEMM